MSLNLWVNSMLPVTDSKTSSPDNTLLIFSLINNSNINMLKYKGNIILTTILYYVIIILNYYIMLNKRQNVYKMADAITLADSAI